MADSETGNKQKSALPTFHSRKMMSQKRENMSQDV